MKTDNSRPDPIFPRYHGYFGNGVRLYDVGNGEVVLDKLSTGGWLETPPP